MAFIILALAGCDGSGSRGETTAGLASLGVNSTWTYVVTFVEAGEAFVSRFHFRIADRRPWRGRNVIVMLSEGAAEAPPTFEGETWTLTTYLDARTGNTVADFDGDTLQTEYVPHDGLLSWPLEVGKTWTATYTEIDYDGTGEEVGSESVTAAHEVLAFEDVTTPAGSFMAYRIERTESSSGDTDTSTYFYDPDLRLIVKWMDAEGEAVLVAHDLR